MVSHPAPGVPVRQRGRALTAACEDKDYDLFKADVECLTKQEDDVKLGNSGTVAGCGRADRVGFLRERSESIRDIRCSQTVPHTLRPFYRAQGLRNRFV